MYLTLYILCYKKSRCEKYGFTLCHTCTRKLDKKTKLLAFRRSLGDRLLISSIVRIDISVRKTIGDVVFNCQSVDIKIKNCVRKHRNNHNLYIRFFEIRDPKLLKPCTFQNYEPK